MNNGYSPDQNPIPGHGSKYDRKKEAVIAALMRARTEQEAALEAGISRKTLCRWKKMREFKTALQARKQEVADNTDARYLFADPIAAATVIKIMVDANVPASVRLRAASQVHAAAEKSVEKEARSAYTAREERKRRRAAAEERSCDAQNRVLNLMGEDGPLYVSLLRQVYAEGSLNREERTDLKRCNEKFISIWRRLDYGFSLLRPHHVGFRHTPE